ncbi:ABC transporter ATP-binding protein [Halorubrum ezzemoulense]|uniref:Nickel import system ATP-binding protein NikD n=1 Tax=Halorubrum ezzemoulense TaxID=337243 RepID=A0A256K532_HALEZ|nr:ABC transporter ATP-binding protein [Halorubrum ezzemoulense]OYR75906.1 ABC transporter ATP-binding protein [Halorubrum ezzemoulense]
MSLLEVQGLKTAFHTAEGTVQAVDDVDIRIDPGEIVGLVGESGSGKSVLTRSIMGLVESPGEVSAEEIRLNGQSLQEMSDEDLRAVRGNSISMIFQDPVNSLNPTLQVGEQIAENIRLHQDVNESVTLSAEVKRKILGAAKNAESWQRAIEMLESVGIPEAESRAQSYPHEFSGGMAQRAMVAMALSCQPDLLIADEPTTGLDVTIQAQILDELEALLTEFDTSILLITHDLAVVAETTTRANVMYAGEIIERAPTEELFDNPAHPYTEALIASTPRLENPDDRIEPIPGSVPDLIDIPYACHFSPRCPEATEECFELEPEPVDIGTNHEASCLKREPVGDL